jgi:hypothetical protein
LESGGDAGYAELEKEDVDISDDVMELMQQANTGMQLAQMSKRSAIIFS